MAVTCRRRWIPAFQRNALIRLTFCQYIPSAPLLYAMLQCTIAAGDRSAHARHWGTSAMWTMWHRLAVWRTAPLMAKSWPSAGPAHSHCNGRLSGAALSPATTDSVCPTRALRFGRQRVASACGMVHASRIICSSGPRRLRYQTAASSSGPFLSRNASKSQHAEMWLHCMPTRTHPRLTCRQWRAFGPARATLPPHQALTAWGSA